VAFAKAAGEFVALLDSDDRWFPDHLARSIRELRETGKDLAYSTVLMIEDETDWILGIWGPDYCDLRDLPHRLFIRNFITPSATVLRRQVLADVGPWDTDLRYCEDLSFWLRCYAAGKQFHYVGGCHCLYRKNHEGAATRKLCETLEMFAVVAERFMHLPGLRAKTVRKFTAKAYIRAAEAHATLDPKADPSADRTRVAPLLLHAWRIRPKRLKYLFRGLRIGLVDRLRGRKLAVLAPVTSAVLPAAALQPAPVKRAA
jgi:glycosyltransferase involved in cell wall biosynthesis